MMILSLAILPVFLGLEAAVLSARRTQLITVATSLLQDRAETIKFQGIYSVGSSTEATYTTTETSYKGTPFTIQIDVSDVLGMTGVRKFVLKAFREPVTAGALPLATMEFVLYEDGV